MRVAVSDLLGSLPDTFEFIYDTGMIFNSKKGKKLDFMPLLFRESRQKMGCSQSPL